MTIVIVAMLTGVTSVGAGVAILIVLFGQQNSGDCGGAAGSAGAIVLGPPGSGQLVGATEYGGPGDPSSGTLGARGDDLLTHPDTYAELGGLTWQTATAMGGLAYMTPLRISWGAHSAIAYKRDFGLGGGPIAGLPRVIDLWWQLAGRLGIPYENGMWSGPVRVGRPPDPGAASVLGQTAPAATASGGAMLAPSAAATERRRARPGRRPACRSRPGSGAAVARAVGGRTAERAGCGQGDDRCRQPDRRQAVRVRRRPRPSTVRHRAGYDCSSSVEHLLYGARLLPVTYGAASSALEGFGAPGPGRWVTLYASADHVFMYVAGLRWDTHDAAGPGDGSGGIGWHPLVRSAAGFVARHPVGL